MMLLSLPHYKGDNCYRRIGGSCEKKGLKRISDDEKQFPASELYTLHVHSYALRFLCFIEYIYIICFFFPCFASMSASFMKLSQGIPYVVLKQNDPMKMASNGRRDFFVLSPHPIPEN